MSGPFPEVNPVDPVFQMGIQRIAPMTLGASDPSLSTACAEAGKRIFLKRSVTETFPLKDKRP